MKKQKSKKQTKEKKSLFQMEISIFGVSLSQKVLLAKHLSIMLKSGLPLPEALKIIRDQSSGKLKKVLTGVLSSVKAGRSLSESFSYYPRTFSGLFINVVKSGEVSGNLEKNLANIAEQLERERKLKSKIKGAMFYPIVVSVVAFGLGMALAFFVLPKITPLFEGLQMDLPITTKFLIWFSHLIRDYGGWLLSGILGFVFLLVWLARQRFSRPVTHWLLLKIPLIKKISSDTNLARFCRTLAMLLKSGLNIDEALEVSKDSLNNYYFRKSLSKVSSHVSRGSKISGSLSDFKDLYPAIVIQMIKVGEESGRLEETLFYLGDFYNGEVDNATKSLSTVIEPALLIVIGAVVAFLALSIITPIYEITGNIRR